MKNRISSQKFDNYATLSQSAKNWDIHCAYQLFSHALHGENHVIELPAMQISYSFREGGFMHRAIAPEDTVSIAVILKCEGVASFDRMKLKEGDIVFFDDSMALHFMSRDKIEIAAVSLPNTKHPALSSHVHAAKGKRMRDEMKRLTKLLQQTLEHFTKEESIGDLQRIEDAIEETIASMFAEQIPETPKLTKGETVAFEILEKVYGHMDGKIDIKQLAQEYAVSEHTLQSSFKSLFGFTPKRFFRLLKLNHAHYDLTYADPQSVSVSRIAQKWGFAHMGRFSRYYFELFGESPSSALKRVPVLEGGVTSECAARQDEI